MWTITDGDYYVHAALGLDTNDGSEATPFKTIQKAFDSGAFGDKIVARGVFHEVTSGGLGMHIIGDGYFEMKGFALIGFAFYILNSVTNCVIRGYDTTIHSTDTFKSCVFIECTVVGQHNTSNEFFQNCVFISCGTVRLECSKALNCTFYNCTTVSILPSLSLLIVKNSLFNRTIGTLSITSVNVSDFNCFEDGLLINGETLAQRQAGLVLEQHSIGPVDSGMNKITDGDYTLSVTSPCLGVGEGGADIGSTYKSLYLNGLNALFDGVSGNGSKDANVNIDGNGVVSLVSGEVGTITSDVIDLPTNGISYPVGMIRLFGAENILDGDGFDLTLLENLVYEMRWGATSTACLAASFEPFLRRKEPTIDSSGQGNANTLFDPLTEVPLNAEFIQIKVTLRSIP